MTRGELVLHFPGAGARAVGLTILPSKLQIPLPPPKTLVRPRLAAQLDVAFRAPATLIAADAGFGKSTLVASFLASDRRPSVWYRLDPGDSDPSVFASYLLHGLKSHVPVRAHSSATRGLSLVSDWNTAAQFLSLALHRLRDDILLVLDDFHLLAARTLSEGVTRLIETLPARAHLVLLSRVQPDLPLARWRAQGRLAELGTDDLRFDIAELRALLVDLHALPLSEAALHVIAARTEGWPAGIILTLHAAIAQGPQAATQSLSTLSGSTRDIYDYLAQEAFARQPARTQRFLLVTAAVSRFSLPLADVLLNTAMGENRAILDELERSHLFIVPLDRERRWYRYHHLFEEFLRRIAAEQDALWVRDVHRRAAEWWEQHGEVNEALHHLIVAGEFQRAALVLGAHGVEMVAHGHLETIRRWLAAIPGETWAAAPRLFLIQGLTDVILGEARTAMRSFDEARRRLRATGDVEGESTALRWLVNAAAWEGGIPLLTPLRAELAEVETRVQGVAPGPRAHILAATARIAHWTGDISIAERRCRAALEAARASGDDYTELWCARPWFDLLCSTARFREAGFLYEDVLARARRKNWWHEAAHLHTEFADLLLSIGRDDAAERHLGEARMLQASIPCRVLQSDLMRTSAQAAARQGARDRAEALLRELLGSGEGATPYGFWRFLATVDLSLLLADSDRDEAQRLATQAVEVREQFGVQRQGQALLAAGIVTQSVEYCQRASKAFAGAGTSHWQALALLHAAAVAPPEMRVHTTESVIPVLRALTPEAWEFLRAQAPRALFAPYHADAVVAPYISQLTASPAPPQMRTAIRCLGSLQVIREGRSLGTDAWSRVGPRRVLQYLLLHDTPVHREEVIETLWPGVEPGPGANQLRVALARLRRVLEPERRAGRPSQFLLASGPTIALARDRLDVDLDRFRRALARAAVPQAAIQQAALAEAVELYRGALFADDLFEEWIQPHRDRLSRQYVEALGRLAEAEEKNGRHEVALARWLAAVEADPTAEHAYRGLIRCYLALGRGADALRAFEMCRQALEELGAAPSPETLAVRELIPRPGQETRR